MLKAAICAIAILAMSATAMAQTAIVKGTAAPPTAAATQATQTNAAVVSKGLTSTTVTVPPSSEPQEYQIDLKPLIDALLPYIAAGLGLLITTICAALAAFMRNRWNVQTDKDTYDKIQTAAFNAAGALLAKGVVKIEASGKVTVKSQALADVANTVLDRVPKANYSEEQVQNLVVAKISQLPPVTVVEPKPA